MNGDEDAIHEILDRWEESVENGSEMPPEELCAGRPDLLEIVRQKIARQRAVSWVDRKLEEREDFPPDEILEAGTVIGDCYRVESLIAQGGQGQVYRGFDLRIERSVAIKVAHRDRRSDQLLVEARNAAQVRHPGIVPILYAGIHEGRFFVVSPLIQGKTLEELMQCDWTISAREAVVIVAQVADALHAAHERGVIHRDIKPSNIIIGEEDGQPQIMDFGIATSPDDLASGKSEATVGTLEYMAPEQVAGIAPRIDRRSDIYALGVLLYELLVGKRPYSGDTPVQFQQNILIGMPMAFEDQSIPEELRQICFKCLSKSPDDRYSTASDLAESLCNVEFPKIKTRRRIKKWHMAAVAGFLAVAFYLYWMPIAFARETIGHATTDRVVFVWVMSPNVEKIAYSFDGLHWMPAAIESRTFVMTSARIKIEHVGGSRTGYIYIRCTYTSGFKSWTRRISIGRDFYENAQTMSPIEHDIAKPIAEPTIERVYLADLPEHSVSVYGTGIKKGGTEEFSVLGAQSKHGIILHPPGFRSSTASYRLERKYRAFHSQVAIRDGIENPDPPRSPLTFEVFGDRNSLWKSRPIDMTGVADTCEIDVSDIQSLTIRVNCPGEAYHAQAVWVDPCLIPK